MPRRMIDSCLSISEKWNGLSDNFSRLLYVMMIVHADPYGRGAANSVSVKLTVIPGLLESTEKISAALNELANSGLIQIYTDEKSDKYYYFIVNWERFQNFNDKNRRYQSKYPDPSALNTTQSQCGTIKNYAGSEKLEVRSLNLGNENESLNLLVDDSKSESPTPIENPDNSKKTDTPKSKPSFHFEQVDLELAELLKSLILENNPNHKITGSIESWANEIRMMRKLDNRPETQIRDVIEWCQKDSFWWPNILSTKKLRAQYDKLLAKSIGCKSSAAPGAAPSTAAGFDPMLKTSPMVIDPETDHPVRYQTENETEDDKWYEYNKVFAILEEKKKTKGWK